MADYQKTEDDFDYDSYDHETTIMVSEAEKDCEKKEKIFADHKTLTRNAKAEYETSVINLRSLIKQRDQERGPGRRQGEFNFDQARQEEAPKKPAVDEEEWRVWPVSILLEHGLKQFHISAMLAKGINTIGDFNKWLQPNSEGFGNKITDLDGIGPVKAQEIEEALQRMWAWRDQQNGNASTTGTGSESAGDVGTSEEAADSESGEIPITVPADDEDEEDDFEEGLDEDDE